MVLYALKFGNDISPHVPSQIPDTCSLGSGTIRLSLNNISLLPTPALGLGMGMVEAMRAEPKFAVHPYYLLHLLTHDSFGQKRNNSASQWTFIHSFMGIFWVPIMISTMLSAGKQNWNALLQSWNLQSSQEDWQNSGKHYEENPVCWYRIMGGREKGGWKVGLRDGGQRRPPWGGDIVPKEDPVMPKQRWRVEHCAKDPRPEQAWLVGRTTVSKGTVGLSQGREKAEGYPMQVFSRHRIQ